MVLADVREGTKHDFNETTNNEWLTQTRPILEAFWHKKYFLTMMAKYAKARHCAAVLAERLGSRALPIFDLMFGRVSHHFAASTEVSQRGGESPQDREC